MIEMRPHRPELRLVALITDVDAVKRVDSLMNKARVHIQYQFRCESTATRQTLDYLGLAKTDKTATICIVPKAFATRLVEAFSAEFNLSKPGTGLTFIIPLSGVSNPVMKILSEETAQKINTRSESEVEQMSSSVSHALILAIVNQGFSEDVMDAARLAGATGGTVIHGRRIGLADTMKFWGISVQDEKDIVTILTKKEQKVEIMQAIGQSCGMHSEARGIVLSLPVDSVLGLEQNPILPEE